MRKPRVLGLELTRGLVTLVVLAALGIALIAYRFLFGLGAVTNLSDGYPWGFWIGIDILVGIALAAGGFVMAGLVHIDGLLDPVSGQVVMTALDSLTDPGNLDPSDDRSPAQRRADALVDLCRDHLNQSELPTQRTERPHVMVHLSIDALEGRAGRPCELDDAGVITPRAARQLACDAKVTRIITTGESQVLDVGRATRVVGGGMRKALTARDRGCVIAGCGAPRRWCDAHHVKHWADGGPTSLDNLVLLCGRHHTLVHDGKVRIPSLE